MIVDYSTLCATLAAWLHRDDLTGQIPDFISLAESKLNAELDSRSMDARTVITATGGNAYVTIPVDMLEMRRLVVQGDPTNTLKYVSPDEIQTDYPSSYSGKPVVFSVIGGEIQLAPIPDADYLIEITYQQKIPSLTSLNTTNWLIEKWPNAYLYGALCCAQPYILDDARLATFQMLYKDAVIGINGINWYSGSTMRVRAS